MPNSYWLPGQRVAAGEYPGDRIAVQARARLESVLDAGIRSFVDLTEERDGLEPYDTVLRTVAAERGLDVRYSRFGVRDMGVPPNKLMLGILGYIESEVDAGRPVYVHCWGGVGRTGIVVGCILAQGGVGCQEALDLVGSLFRTMPAPKVERFPEGSPQTGAQRDFVLGWAGATGAAPEPYLSNPNQSEPVRLTFDTASLIRKHPPILLDGNKRLVHSIACPHGAIHSGQLHFSRWPAMTLPRSINLREFVDRVETRAGFFNYAVPTDGGVEWHVNFADPELFGFYSGPLFAQDEMQVAEHPALASLREALRPQGLARTEERGSPTPVVIAGVERRCRVASDLNPAEGRPAGLYGNAFARASAKAVTHATTPLSPPTISNIIAIAAPRGHGRYTASQIDHIVVTAFTGFKAAAIESTRLWPGARVTIHTGFWGCGAFGGNRTLMVALQFVAACLAEVDGLVVHTGPVADASYVRDAMSLLMTLPAASTAELLTALDARGFSWGASDGN